MRDTVHAKLAEAQAQLQTLLQQRARLTELLAQAEAQIQQSEGRIQVLTELLAPEVPPLG